MFCGNDSPPAWPGSRHVQHGGHQLVGQIRPPAPDTAPNRAYVCRIRASVRSEAAASSGPPAAPHWPAGRARSATGGAGRARCRPPTMTRTLVSRGLDDLADMRHTVPISYRSSSWGSWTPISRWVTRKQLPVALHGVFQGQDGYLTLHVEAAASWPGKDSQPPQGQHRHIHCVGSS